MGQDFGIIDLINWLSLVFPSLTQYSKVIMPMIITGVGIISIFSNILPKPGEHYPIPPIEDLDVELKGKGRVTYVMVRVTRFITITFNRFIDTWLYKAFFNMTNFCSVLIKKFKGHATNEEAVEISTPKPYVFEKLKRKLREKKDD
jgi:hypothetical protein